jgi:predicted nucleic acid-binding protein
MIFDTDILIWFLRGNIKAARAIDKEEVRSISLITYMELLQGSTDKQESRQIKAFLKDFGFSILPLSENIGHRASIYVEEYALSNSIGVADALVAATVVEENEVLLTANTKHFMCVKELQLKQFRP